MPRDLGVAAQSGREHEAHLSLLEHIAGPVPDAGLRSGITDQFHAEGAAIEVSRLARVADVELDVVGAFQGEEVIDLERVG